LIVGLRFGVLFGAFAATWVDSLFGAPDGTRAARPAAEAGLAGFYAPGFDAAGAANVGDWFACIGQYFAAACSALEAR